MINFKSNVDTQELIEGLLGCSDVEMEVVRAPMEKIISRHVHGSAFKMTAQMTQPQSYTPAEASAFSESLTNYMQNRLGMDGASLANVSVSSDDAHVAEVEFTMPVHQISRIARFLDKNVRDTLGEKDLLHAPRGREVNPQESFTAGGSNKQSVGIDT